MNKLIYISIVTFFLSTSIIYVIVNREDSVLSESSVDPTPPIVESSSPMPTAVLAPPVPVTSEPTEGSVTNEEVYYPMTNYQSRITNRGYGQRIVESDSEPLPCGDAFSGLHTGDDLEVSDDELNVDVPVYAIADGTVVQVSLVSGYGGLVIIEHNLDSKVVTAYYGHVDLSKTTVTVGADVEAGQQISVLGESCSSQTSGERKHLHFSIREDLSIDVRGYVDTNDQLQSWINPEKVLRELKATEPK